MTLTDIISKITLYAKRAIVNDNSTSSALTINQTGTGGAISIQTTAKGSLNLMPASGGEISFDGGSDGIFGIINTSAAPTKATCFQGANLGILTNTPTAALHVNGSTRLQGSVRMDAATSTTVGAAGGASALPATPTGYITININGTDRKIPYYTT